MLSRGEPRDAIVSGADSGWDLESIPTGLVVGTGSPRRRCQILHARPDLEVRPIRGNVDTRVRKLQEGEVDVLVLAMAGIERLGLRDVRSIPMAVDLFVPAVGQGALAVEIREDHDELAERLELIDHARSRAEVAAERAFLSVLEAGCMAPAACFARILGERMHVFALVGASDGRVVLAERETGPPQDGVAIGSRLARRLRVAGAERLLDGK